MPLSDAEITRLLATKVMGWTVVMSYEQAALVRREHQSFWADIPTSKAGMAILGAFHADGMPWSPTRYIADAWMVQDAIRALGSGNPAYRAYCDALFEHHNYLFVPALQACWRICDAALRAVGVEPEG